MSKLIGYRILTIDSEKSIPLLEKSINEFLKDGWTLHGTTMNTIVGKMCRFSQTMAKYLDSTEPRILKYRLYACSNYTSAFETKIIEEVQNKWTFFGHTWHTIDSEGVNYYSQALVQYESLDGFL